MTLRTLELEGKFMRQIIAVSGPIAVGKSAFISELQRRLGAERISTRTLIQSLRDVPNDRGPLQEAGEALDRDTDGKWVADALEQNANSASSDTIVIVDSVRIAKQVRHLRSRFGARVQHVHLTASDGVLAARFQRRKELDDPAVREFASYEEARANATEAGIEELAKIADVCIVTDKLTPHLVGMVAIEKLRLAPAAIASLVDVVVGGQYGSEGKGNICDYLASEYDVLVRVGGPNAGHKVKEPEYVYVHMPSGTGGNPNARILIGAGATLDVDRVLTEIRELNLDPSRLAIDPQAIIIEPSDLEFEETLGEKIGSTKKGVGVATARKIIGRDGQSHLGAPVTLAEGVPALGAFIRPVTNELARAYSEGKRILLEGTQGTDLSIHHGIYPKVTSRETTVSGCLADAGISPRRVNRIYMVTRTYPIRVGGDSGTMGMEIDFETVAVRSGVPVEQIKATEVGTISGKPRRIAEFSWERIERAAQLNGATDIVLTFADYISVQNQNAKTYDELTDATKELVARLEDLTGVPVTLVAVGFGRDRIIDRRGAR